MSKYINYVVPAKAGIQFCVYLQDLNNLGSRLRGNDADLIGALK